MLKALDERRQQRLTECESTNFQTVKSDPHSLLIFFLLRAKDLKKCIPDYEFTTCKAYFFLVIKANPKCHEGYFGLGRLLSYESKFKEALKYVNIAISIKNDPFYVLWSVVIAVKCNQIPRLPGNLSPFLCCLSKSQNTKEILLQRLESLPITIESLWCYMELARNGIQEEAAEYYATCIKDIDPYLGYLAWSEIFVNVSWEKAIGIMKELVKQYPNRPEAYVKLWSYYYYEVQNFEQAEDIAAEAFLRVTDSETTDYYVIFCLACSKSYFKTGKVTSALQLLQKKFIENSQYPLFLYQYGRLCCKSEDFVYNGSAISALKECLRLCDSSKLGQIHYWLSKAYMQNRYCLEAYKHCEKGLKYLNSTSLKSRQLQNWINDNQVYILEIRSTIEKLSKELSGKALVNCLETCKKIKNFHKLCSSVLLAKLMWKIGHKAEAIEKLSYISDMSTVKMMGYFELLKCFREINEWGLYEKTAARMVHKCKNPQVPTGIWVKANVLYAKSLIANNKPCKAILVLKCISKLFTPMPYANIEYTRTLQKANNIIQLLDPYTNNYALYDSYKGSFTNIKETPVKKYEEDDAPVPQTKNFKGRRPGRKLTEGIQCFSKFSLEINEKNDDEIDDRADFVSQSIEANQFIGISVCSNPKFLYILAKVAARSKTGIDDGICAILDYLELLKFEKNMEKAARLQKKAEEIHSALTELNL